MIFRKNNKTSKNKIINNIKEIFKSNKIKFYIFDKKDEDSYYFYKQKENTYNQGIKIGIKDLSYYNDNWVFVKKIVEVFHEIEHFNQLKDLCNYLSNNKVQLSKKQLEVCCSIELKSKYQGIEKLKYTMLSSELSAELYGILKAKKYFEEKHPSVDFEKHLLEYVNNVERWYGPKPLKGDRPTFSSFEEVVVYLYENLEIAYDYPVPIEYDGFNDKVESVRVANLDSGAEQFYLIAKDLCNKKLVSKPILDATKELMDYYCKNKDRKISNKKEETVDDILLSTDDVSSLKPSISIVDTSKNINLLDIDK